MTMVGSLRTDVKCTMLLLYGSFVLLLVCCNAKPWHGDLDNDLAEEDRGSWDNCGDPATNLTFQWSPKAIAPGDVITLYLEMDSVLDYNDGKFCMELWVKEIPTPIFKVCEPEPCSEHTSVNGHKVRWAPHAIAPPNNYVVKANMFNEAGQETMCAKGPLTIRRPGPTKQPPMSVQDRKGDSMTVARMNQEERERGTLIQTRLKQKET